MTESKPRATDSRLVVSSRLSAMRQNNPALVHTSQNPTSDHDLDTLDAETRQLWVLIEERLSQIFATLPAGKKHSLFKIRYGMDIQTLKQQPIERMMQVLKLSAPKHPNRSKPPHAKMSKQPK